MFCSCPDKILDLSSDVINGQNLQAGNAPSQQEFEGEQQFEGDEGMPECEDLPESPESPRQEIVQDPGPPLSPGCVQDNR